MLREAEPHDAELIEAFLSQHPAHTMFLRSNMAAHGIGWTEARNSTRYFLWQVRDVQGVFGWTREGFLMAYCADSNACAAFAKRLKGETVKVMTGAPETVRGVLGALGLLDAEFAVFEEEPLYMLDLADLKVDPRDSIRPPVPEDVDLLTDWFAQYEVDTGLSTPEQAAITGKARAQSACEPERTIRLLLDDGATPVAMAALNAQLPDIVQIGGVFVPHALRNRGLGRRVTRALLAEAAARGVHRAVLFAQNPAAARAYEAIGFRHIGRYLVAVLAEPAVVEVPK